VGRSGSHPGEFGEVVGGEAELEPPAQTWGGHGVRRYMGRPPPPGDALEEHGSGTAQALSGGRRQPRRVGPAQQKVLEADKAHLEFFRELPGPVEDLAGGGGEAAGQRGCEPLCGPWAPPHHTGVRDIEARVVPATVGVSTVQGPHLAAARTDGVGQGPTLQQGAIEACSEGLGRLAVNPMARGDDRAGTAVQHRANGQSTFRTVRQSGLADVQHDEGSCFRQQRKEGVGHGSGGGIHRGQGKVDGIGLGPAVADDVDDRARRHRRGAVDLHDLHPVVAPERSELLQAFGDQSVIALGCPDCDAPCTDRAVEAMHDPTQAADDESPSGRLEPQSLRAGQQLPGGRTQVVGPGIHGHDQRLGGVLRSTEVETEHPDDGGVGGEQACQSGRRVLIGRIEVGRRRQREHPGHGCTGAGHRLVDVIERRPRKLDFHRTRGSAVETNAQAMVDGGQLEDDDGGHNTSRRPRYPPADRCTEAVPLTAMSFEEFLHWRGLRVEWATHAAGRLAAGDPGPARLRLGGFAGAAEDEAWERLLHHLNAGGPSVGRSTTTALLGPIEDLPGRPLPHAAPHVHRWHLVERSTAQGREADTLVALAAAIDELAFLGDEIQRRHRAAWTAHTFEPDDKADARAARLWSGWASDNPYKAMARFRKAYLPAARSAFVAELRALRMRDETRLSMLDQMEEAFAYRLLLPGDATKTPGWVEVALRVLETAGQGPIASLARLLGTHSLDAAARCAASRGHWPATASLAFPGTGARRGRSLALLDAMGQGRTEPLLDLHVATRLVESWVGGAGCEPERNWRIVLANRGRARGRLRAVLAREASQSGTDPIVLQLRTLEGLHARTRAAVGWYARDWARKEVRSHSFDALGHVTAPCTLPEPSADMGESASIDGRIAATWVFLATLRGQLGRLERWVTTGSTGDRDATWGRVLKLLPDALADAHPGGRRARTFDSLRHHLRAEWADTCVELRARCVALVEGAEESDAKLSGKRFSDLTATHWHVAIPRPTRGLARMVEAAARAVDLLDKQETA